MHPSLLEHVIQPIATPADTELTVLLISVFRKKEKNPSTDVSFEWKEKNNTATRPDELAQSAPPLQPSRGLQSQRKDEC